MCTSVPQIDAFNTRISTSSPLTFGTGTSSSQRPGSGLAFTTAFIVFCTGKKLSTDFADSHRFLRRISKSVSVRTRRPRGDLSGTFSFSYFFLLDATSQFWQKRSGQIFAEGRAKQIRTIERLEMSSPREKSKKATTLKEKLN